MKKNYLISTGGSGGHVIPALIFHQHLSGDANIIISSDKRGLKYLNKDKYNLEIVNTPKLSSFILLPINLLLILILTFRSIFLLKNKKIEKLISTGGYMSLPLIFAAKLLQINIYLIEPNQILGRANKFFLSSCEKIFCYNKKIKNFPNKFMNKIIVINPLVKKEVYEKVSSTISKDKFNLLIVGGSQGANIFNNNLKNSIINISKKIKIKVFQQTNEKNILYLNDFYKRNNIENKIFDFERNFENIVKEADLCITRAGASTLAELSVLNIPFIAVPLPTAKDNHQFENAKFYKDHDCCWIIEQNYFEEKIEEFLKDIIEKKSDYLKKIENLKKLNYQNTWINVNQKITKNINEN